ncbi:hypothetical protein [Streptomyces sp. NPDC001743]|uniref:hypothetical protein n=1 Tax=Streptomyces sp. NPDC001743 TaxID=3154397 RepID=UPI0033259216
MSTTRHLVNRQRRLATVAAERTAAPAPVREPAEESQEEPQQKEQKQEKEQQQEKERAAEEKDPSPGRPARLRITLPAVLCAATVLLGAFAAWAFTAAGTLNADPSRRNTALTDISRTSEVKGQITEAVGAVFSYNYASPAKADTAVKKFLTGKAVQQHTDMLAEVRAQAPKQKLVLTTTVTDSGVELLDGDRARLIIFADQSNTRTGKAEETTYAAAMFAVDAVRRDGTWRISAIDTFTR